MVRGVAWHIDQEGWESLEVNWVRTGLIILHWVVKGLVAGPLKIMRNHPFICLGRVPGRIELPL